MNKVMALAPHQEHTVSHKANFDPQQLQILKNSICKDLSNDEFEVFLMACNKTQLDPFMRQIYAVKRGGKMTIQTGIDGYRLIAERTGYYAPGQEPTYIHDENGRLISSTAYIRKQTKDGTWHTVSSSAYIDEYCQSFTDKYTGEKKPTGMWATMPRTMLAKCAEAQALRKAFPAEMCNVYTKEEMLQADCDVLPPANNAPPAPLKITAQQAYDLKMILDECDESFRNRVMSYVQKQCKSLDLADITVDIYESIKSPAVKNMNDNYAKQKQNQELLIEA